ncbi:5-(carboxyamino)imidazole ribonucleotide synthase [Oscillatoria sp. CS-180]|uniref:5-(carboxyamino)imidazole ribonucleotide synthase n=1 Tax=Oscillatoria sp. CS-180 TaxID=3021720 RepID=UPI00232D1B62|nr:5-(carboxyamino)imidazole ribonucleotide synthase [Oscillatoria sp. CS-180]MDB9528151.1 5-(carboxyamino)imidazole ribonucleotide synthase [Oscillatoria sp. CS-180]
MSNQGIHPKKQRIGVIGGGQLAWMMAMEAQELGMELVVQTPKLTDPAVTIALNPVLAPVADPAGTQILSDRCDVITFENEFVDLSALNRLETAGTLFRPRLQALEPLLDKYTQRQFLAAHGLPNPPYVTLDANVADEVVHELAGSLGFPLVLKTRRLGYDGQGTFILRSADELLQTWSHLNRPPVLLEAFIPFEKELAVMVARSLTGDIAVYPVVETQQVDQVCRRVFAPAQVAPAVGHTVDAIARTLITQLDFVGVLGIELFLAPGNKVLVNEVAPRTHNSGHYTLNACETSQFAQQLLAVSGQPLSSPAMTCDRALMVNLLGFENANSDYAKQRQLLAQIPNAHVYWYGKQESRPGRKLGHVTVCYEKNEEGREIAQHIEATWYPAANS